MNRKHFAVQPTSNPLTTRRMARRLINTSQDDPLEKMQEEAELEILRTSAHRQSWANEFAAAY